ncbi:TPM domain-containing protein [Streptomyces sp. NPDC060194]|uniref:TPM domain-containing protein n=1 Tax=Streptomyces sp. NPDC060194 TaxID=3347069 RepID=UPI00364C35ED
MTATTSAAKRRTPRTRARAALVAALFCLTALPHTAHAEDPVTLSRSGQVTDGVDALGDRADEVDAALDRLYDDRRVQLFVTYVRDFSGEDAQSWADATATRNGLGQDDLLLAVATDDRRYAYSVDDDAPLTDDELRDVAATAIEPALRANDWAGAAVGAANGYDAVLGGDPVPTPTIRPGDPAPGGSDGGGAGTGWLLGLVAVAAAGLVALLVFNRRRRPPGPSGPAADAPAWGGSVAQRQLPLADLDAHAKQLLVETDDAVRTSEEELGFATAQFGENATRPFADALAFAKGELTAAFRLRQQLDDAEPEDDPTRRRMLDEIVARCTEADRRLDAESDAFDRLRDLERTAPQAVESAGAAFRALTTRTTAAASALAGLRQRYAESATAAVASNVDQAQDRLVFATESLNQARQALAAEDNAQAAVYVRAAEGAVGQATTLVDAVDRRAAELTEAAERLTAATTETETDLADARGLLEGTAQGASTADLRGRIARAEAVLADVAEARAGGPWDPIDALRRVEEADTALDEALSGARERESGDRRAAALFDQAALAARSAVDAATDYVTTHRGAVGSQARTRLAEAQRHLAAAGPLAAADPADALAEVQRADALARQAQQLAEQDVRAYGDPYSRGPARGGVMGGSGGAVLGGIILGELLGGGRGGGFGGGGFGGGGFGGGPGPGSFGGGGTRGRRGGGGRF